MARPTGKKPTKSVAISSSTTVTPQPSSTIPAPFKPVPQSIRAFANTLPTDHIYLVHIDPTDIVLKRRVFVVPVLLNIVIVLILCIRIYYAAPVYLNQIITIFGYDTAYTVDTKNTSSTDILSTLTSRTVLLMIDYTIFALLGSWPKEFLFGSKTSRFTGPWEWRRTLGFQSTEIVVRRGRKWDVPLVEKAQAKAWGTDEELGVKFKIEPAMRKSYTSKTGYLLLDKDWDLDFRAMLDAHRLVKGSHLGMGDLENLALVFYQNQWLVWNVHEGPSSKASSDAEQDSTMRRFKDKLTKLGQEDTFYRWIEMIQFETSQPGGFTEGKQADCMRELRRLLTDRGVDYAKFWEDIGGQKGLPGFDQMDT